MSKEQKTVYFLGSDIQVPRESVDKVSNIRGFVSSYCALSGGLLPSDGYVALFDVNNENDIERINRELAKIKGLQPRMLLSGLLFGPVIRKAEKKY